MDSSLCYVIPPRLQQVGNCLVVYNVIASTNNIIISESAVKKQARSIKSIIKLDKNFHIYVHGHRKLIEQGVDEQGRKFYKISYNEES